MVCSRRCGDKPSLWEDEKSGSRNKRTEELISSIRKAWQVREIQRQQRLHMQQAVQLKQLQQPQPSQQQQQNQAQAVAQVETQIQLQALLPSGGSIRKTEDHSR
ncbi:hypothetical protein L211DRAFT_837147 [Terfezia boudieri ATCC MYA-4762]|uniref:Uncharacterized protein n=1 Tax=Terfezia boudieri ATCC MYA-4762 TaxID=1051890 RepID=A0A3N4LPJ1_9PEZI|nr:hypothetical protein L211DRAFT_837147 [Terfezia boudieri ATCC MYA-4762]